MTRTVDLVIVGAGAAGIAAARRLRGTGLRVVMIEAADRLGGRAWTRTVEGHPLDLGCAWLHSGDRNPWTGIAADLGLAVDRTPPPWGEQAGDRNFTPAEQADADRAIAAFERRLRAVSPDSDVAADALEPGNPWNGLLQAVSGYVNGAALEQVSARDHVAYDEADTGVNWRVREGMGTAIVAAAAGTDFVTGCRVTAVDLPAGGVWLETTAGPVAARAAILTVATDVLASGAVRLPRTLDHKREAAAHLPLGLADKIVFALDGAEGFDPDTHAVGNPRSAETGAYHLRPFGRPLIEGFYGGIAARMLHDLGEAGAIAFALDDLAGLFGTDVRRRLRPILRTDWTAAPFVGGAYSHALPGRSAARAVLAEPVERRLFFAGEACSAVDFTAAHGAHATGTAAAAAALAALRQGA
jgi:monoamine oxidase